jgi:DNA-binding PadR family transcriptional regulator
VFHILLALSSGERHGYGIMKQVELDSQGKVNMGPGTLYGSIQRMLMSGLIEEVSRGKSGSRSHLAGADDDERRRYYRLSLFGHRVLELELARLARVVQVARMKHLLHSPEPA